MRAACLIAAAISLIAVPAIGNAKPVAKPAMKADWTHVVTATPDGGFRIGNPKAKVVLVEYGSLACPHCRHFEETGYKPLVDNYVRSGKVSYEFRNYLLNAPDVAVSLLAHCAGPSKFFRMSDVVFSTQMQWEGKIASLPADQQAEIAKLSDTQQVARYAELAGFPKLASRFGLTAAQSHQCLADPKGMERLLAVTRKAAELGVTGTPTFFINGKISDARTWEQLEPALRDAGG